MDGNRTDHTREILQRIQDLSPLVARHQTEFDAERRLAQPVVDAMIGADLFRLWVPRRFGGSEVSPRAMIDIVEAAAALDASFGWCLTNAAAAAQFTAYLPEEVAGVWVAQPDCQMSGSTAALGIARRTEGGFVVNGRWPFASGILSARRVSGLCKIDGEGDPASPELMFCHFDVRDVSIIDTWYVTGLKGSGSNDFSVSDHFVPLDHCHGFVGARPVEPGSLYRFPIVSLLCLSVAIVPLGIARAAIAAFVALADQTRAGNASAFKDRELIQSEVGRAEALQRSGKALVIAALEDLERALDIGGRPLIEARAFFRLALAHSAENCLKACEMMVACAGAAAIFDTSPLARCQRDLQAATKHIAVAPHLFALGGRITMGMEPGLARF